MPRILDQNINRIKFFNSTTAGAIPAGGDLVRGELAFNLADRTIFSHNGSTIVELGFGKGGTVNGAILGLSTITAVDNIKSNAKVLSDTGLSIATDNGDGRGVALYGDAYSGIKLPSYGLSFAKASTFNGHGAVADGDWATYFTMSGGASRGWIFKNVDGLARNGNVASISSGGIATFNKVVAPEFVGTANDAVRLARTQQVLSNVNAQWYKIATLMQPQSGTTTFIDIVGGAGFNAQREQVSSARIIFKTGNANPSFASIKLEVIDGHTHPMGVAWKDMGNNVYELYVWLGAYWTGYIVPNYPEQVGWYDKGFAPFGGADPKVPPSGCVLGFNVTIARDTSNVATATKLQTSRKLNGVDFDGTKDINVPDSYSQRLTTGVNLNDVNVPGKYYMDYDSEAATITNKPMEGSFCLEVLQTAGLIQRFTNYNTGRTWIRKTYVNMGVWKEIALLTDHNVFTSSQSINAGAESALFLVSSRESSLQWRNNIRTINWTLQNSTYGLWEGGNWLISSQNSSDLNFNANVAISPDRTFKLGGTESTPIQTVFNPNAAITVNSPEAGMAAIRHALSFKWYSDDFQLGTIRSGSQASHGFGITKGNNELLWRVSPQGDVYTKGAILTNAYVDAVGDVQGQNVVSKTGRFTSADQYHWLDVGQNGRDLFRLATYTGQFDFIRTSDSKAILSIQPGSITTTQAIWATGSTLYSDTIKGVEDTSGIRNTTTIVPDNGTRFKAFVHGSMQSQSGYRTHVAFGVSKRSNDWSAAGAMIAVGGQDTNPTESFYFDVGGNLRHSSGTITAQSFVVDNGLTVKSGLVLTGGDFFTQSGSIKTPANNFQFLTNLGAARGICAGGLLVSDSYSDYSNVPTNGAWFKGYVSVDAFTARNTFEATWATVNSLGTSTGININNAAGGGGNNGLRTGNGDAALYTTCNWDIQTHNGLGIKDNNGNRNIVIEARAGTIHCKGDINVRNVNANGTGVFQGNITTNGTIYAAGNITAFSDRRLKENIKPIDNAIERIKKLNGVTYTRNDLDDTTREHAGLIAQDVLAALPQSVVEAENGTLAVDYNSIIGLLVETIKDLNSRLESRGI